MLKYTPGTKVIFTALYKTESHYNGEYIIVKCGIRTYHLNIQDHIYHNDFVAFSEEVMTKVDLLRHKLCSSLHII